MPFKSYTNHEDGSVSFEREDGTWTPKLPPVGATYLEKKRVDLQGQVDPGLVAAIPTVPSAVGPTALAQNQASVPDGRQPSVMWDAPPAKDVDSGGMSGYSAPPANMSEAPKTPPSPTKEAPAAKQKPITGKDMGISAPESDSDRDKQTAAMLERERGLRALRGSPGVWDPGGERLTGYSMQYIPGSSTATLREEERSGMPREVLNGLRRRAEELPLLIKGAKKNPALQRQYVQELLRVQSALEPHIEKEPGDLAALRDLEEKERKVGFLENDLAYVEKRQADDMADLAGERITLKEQRARDVQEFQERKKQKLGAIFGQIDAKRREFEAAGVDQGRFWRERGTGGQIAAAMAMAMGAVGNAIAGNRGPNEAMGIINKAIDQDINLQIQDIDKKGKELGHLAQIYEFAKDELGSEEAGMAAAHLAALDVMATKADQYAAMAQSERARLGAEKIKETIAAQQAQRRLQLEQAQLGTRADQVRVDQPGYKGGKAPNLKEAAEAFASASKLSDDSGKQQFMFGDQRYEMGSFAEAGEGKDTRKNMLLLSNALAEVQGLKKMRDENLRNNSSYTTSADYINKVNRTAANVSKLLDMGVLQGNEREEAQKLYSNMISGKDVLDDTISFLNRMGKGTIDQLGARPVGGQNARPWIERASPKGGK